MKDSSKVVSVLAALAFIALMVWLTRAPSRPADDVTASVTHAVSADDGTQRTTTSTTYRLVAMPTRASMPAAGGAATMRSVSTSNGLPAANTSTGPAIPNGAVQAPYGNAPITSGDWADDPNPVTWGGQPVSGGDRDPLGIDQPRGPMDPAYQRPRDPMDPRQNDPMPHACNHDPFC